MSVRAARLPTSHDDVDLYDYVPPVEATQVGGTPSAREQVKCRRRRSVSDDWPDQVPVTQAELDVFEAHFGAFLDTLLGSKN